MLDEHVGHADLELPQLGHLALDIPRDEVAPPGRSGNSNRPLSPARLSCHDLRGTERRCRNCFYDPLLNTASTNRLFVAVELEVLGRPGWTTQRG